MIAYQTAYLKANYPQCFMAALLTSDLDDTDRIGIEIEECNKMGIDVLPPDVNESFVDFGVVKETNNIRFGLAAIKGIGESPARIITRERKKNGQFKSLEDFIDRMINTDVEGVGDRSVLNKKILESLAKSGGLDNLAERNRVVQGMEIITKRIQESTKQKKSAQIGLFGEVLSADIELGALELPEVDPAPQNQRLAWEKEHLGIYLSENPLKEVGPLIRAAVPNQIGNLSLQMEGRRVKIGGILSEIKKINTRSGQPMAFAKIEDLSGKTEILVFPRLLADTSELWASDNLLIVEGKISTKDNEVKLLADKAERFDPEKVDKSKVVTVSDEDQIVEIDLGDEPEIEGLEAELNKAHKNKKLIFENEKELYVILPLKIEKEKLVLLKEFFEKKQGEKVLILAYKKNGNFEFKKTKVLVGKLGEKEILKILS
jgi:DNA polymerase-3 subunit alpha